MDALATYTDSEEEDDTKGERDPPAQAQQADESGRPPSAVDRLREGLSRGGTPTPTGSNAASSSARSTPTKALRLVSYAEEGEAEHEDDGPRGEERREREEGESDGDVVSMELDSDNAGLDEDEAPAAAAASAAPEAAPVAEEAQGDAASRNRRGSDSIHVEAWTTGGLLPPEPPGRCDPKLQESVNRLFRRKMESGYDMNEFIQNKKSFRNPSIYEKLIAFCGIDETGTNFPKELYDGHLFGKESFYDELSKVQAADMERREKAAAAKRKADAVSAPPGVVKRAPDDPSGKARRSKWDQGAPAPSAVAALPPARPPTNPKPLPKVQAPQVVSASVPAPQAVSAAVAAATAAAAAVNSSKTISAFGPLKK